MFAFGQSVTRLRLRKVRDPYSGRLIGSDWSDPLELIIDGAWIASSSSTSSSDESREQIITQKSLYCQPGADVVSGDRIEAEETVYRVLTAPQADVNPFTGWQPVKEIPLELVEG